MFFAIKNKFIILKVTVFQFFLENSKQLDNHLYLGHVFRRNHPMRQLFSRHYMTLAEYKYSRYPAYATGGCFLVSNYTLIDLYYGSLHLPKFRFDDVFLGMIARKLNIPLTHNEHIYVENKFWYSQDRYKQVVASHFYNDPNELIQVWTEQKKLGNA